jgi:acetyl/propionyl-CoA carboxylase alpha subunit
MIESPSPLLARRGAQDGWSPAQGSIVSYENVGTVDSGRFGRQLFASRLIRARVEHPVTELVSGIDLVKLQISLAAGQPLPSIRRTSPGLATPSSAA